MRSTRASPRLCALAAEPRPHGCQKLSGRDGWRIRVGAYRVLYEIAPMTREPRAVRHGARRRLQPLPSKAAAFRRWATDAPVESCERLGTTVA
jgi:hypothetical protein